MTTLVPILGVLALAALIGVGAYAFGSAVSPLPEPPPATPCANHPDRAATVRWATTGGWQCVCHDCSQLYALADAAVAGVYDWAAEKDFEDRDSHGSAS